MHVCVLERARWCRCRVPLQGRVCRCRSGCGCRVPLQGAAGRCCLKVLLSEWCVRLGAGMPVLRVPCRVLEGAAASALSWPADATAGCCFRVLLLEWCVRFELACSRRCSVLRCSSVMLSFSQSFRWSRTIVLQWPRLGTNAMPAT